MKTILKIILLYSLLCIISCSDNPKLTPAIEDELPPITQTGKNTFGCLINGKVFIPKDKTGYYPPGGGRPRGISIGIGIPDYFTIISRNYLDTYIYIYIPSDTPIKQTYTFKISSGLPSGLDSPSYPHAYIVYKGIKYLTYENSSSITFTTASQNSGIYAGTFNLKLKNKDNPNDIVEITEGRFDINLGTLNQN